MFVCSTVISEDAEKENVKITSDEAHWFAFKSDRSVYISVNDENPVRVKGTDLIKAIENAMNY